MEKVRQRLLRTAAALEKAGVSYAVIDGNAVATWVAKVDESAVRNTQYVDILLRREDLEAAAKAMAAAGFIQSHVAGIDLFLDGENSKARDAVHVIFADEKVRPEYNEPAPSVSEAERADAYYVLGLEPLVRMKLTSYRDKDRTHLRDFIDVGLIDESWCSRLPEALAERLQHLFDNPES